jgi:hypothetical protein
VTRPDQIRVRVQQDAAMGCHRRKNLEHGHRVIPIVRVVEVQATHVWTAVHVANHDAMKLFRREKRRKSLAQLSFGASVARQLKRGSIEANQAIPIESTSRGGTTLVA